jgi:hypothetical protein
VLWKTVEDEYFDITKTMYQGAFQGLDLDVRKRLFFLALAIPGTSSVPNQLHHHHLSTSLLNTPSRHCR